MCNAYVEMMKNYPSAGQGFSVPADPYGDAQERTRMKIEDRGP